MMRYENGKRIDKIQNTINEAFNSVNFVKVKIIQEEGKRERADSAEEIMEKNA